MTRESGAEFIARVARESSLLGEKGRIAWAPLVGLVTPDDLREAVERGWVRVEDVTLHGRTAKHIIAVNGEQA